MSPARALLTFNSFTSRLVTIAKRSADCRANDGARRPTFGRRHQSSRAGILHGTMADLGTLISDSVKQANELRGQFNLLMAGIIGVGKSTLVNAVFSQVLARSSQGKPVTIDII